MTATLTVTALFDSLALAESAADQLIAAGYPSSALSVAVRADAKTALQSGTLGLLTDFGPLALEDISLFVAGPLRRVIEALGAGKAAVSLADAFTAIAMNTRQRDTCIASIQDGSVLLSVEVDGTISAARSQQILDSASPREVFSPLASDDLPAPEGTRQKYGERRSRWRGSGYCVTAEIED